MLATTWNRISTTPQRARLLSIAVPPPSRSEMPTGNPFPLLPRFLPTPRARATMGASGFYTEAPEPLIRVSSRCPDQWHGCVGVEQRGVRQLHEIYVQLVGAGSDTLGLTGNTTPSEWYVDDVVVGGTAAPSVPEPASLAILITSLVGLGFRRFKKSA